MGAAPRLGKAQSGDQDVSEGDQGLKPVVTQPEEGTIHRCRVTQRPYLPPAMASIFSTTKAHDFPFSNIFPLAVTFLPANFISSGF